MPEIKSFNSDHTFLLPIGGLGQFGANMMGLYCQGKLYLLDCGVSFPDSRKLGVDAIVPDCREFIESLGGVEAYIITHGHEDHIGALPVLYRFFPAPIYATKWTTELILKKFARYGYEQGPEMELVNYSNTYNIGDLKVDWIYMTHSLPEASSLYIQSPDLNLYHSGDFKIDAEPVVGDLCDFEKIKNIRKRGVDILLCDSTNAEKPGRTGTEGSIEKPIADLLSQTKGRVFASCFSSNVARIQTLINACKLSGRKLCLVGHSLESTLGLAHDHGLIDARSEVVCGIEEAKYLERKKVCFLLTGSQGEYRGSLARLVYGEMRELSIEKDDVILFSSRIIPGNEKSVLGLMNEIEKEGGTSITNKTHSDIHVSGHAHSEEILELIDLLNPKIFIPVHGTHMHLNRNNEVGKRQRKTKTISTFSNGDVISIDKDLNVKCEGKIDFDLMYVDAFSKSLLSPPELKGRLKIGEHGLVLVTGVVSKSGPELKVKFFGLGDTIHFTQEDMVSRIQEQLRKTWSKEKKKNPSPHDLQEEFRIIVRRTMNMMYGRKPIVEVSLIQ